MKLHWTTDELNDRWTLLPAERALADTAKADHNRLGLAVLLKWHQQEGQFPQRLDEVPEPVLAFVAGQLRLSAAEFGHYDWEGRSIKYHRAAIREFLGVREATAQDLQALEAWFSQEVLPYYRQPEYLKARLAERLRELHIEAPPPERVQRLIRAATAAYDDHLATDLLARLTTETRVALDALLDTPEPGDEAAERPPRSGWHALKAEPGPLGVETATEEIRKLQELRALGLPEGLFAGVAAKVLDSYRQRAAAEDLHELRRHREPLRYLLLAAYCHRRTQELTDGLAELLIDVVHHVGAKAERRVDKRLLRDFKRVAGKTNLLFRMAEAALAQPDGIVHEVIYSVVSEQTLRDLLKEYKTTGSYQQQVQLTMRGSYQHHYRRVVPALIQALAFHSNNAVHRPVIQALDLLKRYAAADAEPTQHHYKPDDEVPLDGVVKGAWRELVVKRDRHGNSAVNRINYELCVLQAVREKLRCKEVWVAGADRFRNPDDDLPADFAAQRATYYTALRQPLDAETFITGLQRELADGLAALDQALPKQDQVKILAKGGGWIAVSPLTALATPANLDRLKAEITQQWPMISLLDMLKEADLRVRFTDQLHSATARENLDRATLQRRLLLSLYGLGTNMGLKRVSAGSEEDDFRDLLYTRRRFLSRDRLRAAIAQVVNAILRARSPALWGNATTTCASDAKKFAAWDQNLLTEWHVRYRGPGIMIYWHVERKSTCIYSQLKSCSSSEVAAMIEGVLRHCTDMTVEKNYVDTHGQSEIAFAFCRLLGFQLLPRLKAIHRQKLYRPEPGRPDAYPNLQHVLTRPIKWDRIRQQYDEMIKYATALRLGTAETEAILRRFTRHGLQHPTYKALAELGKVNKTIFLCQYLRLESLRREIHEALQVIENWNSANGFIFYGKGGEFASNRFEDQEIAMLSLHLLQICLVYINTLMIQQVLAEPQWQNRLNAEDMRALTPLFYNHVNPYGKIHLDMDTRLAIEEPELAYIRPHPR
jgi:TnpA family transposase